MFKYIFTLASIIIVLNSSAQDYIPFPDSLATWSVYYNNIESGSGFSLGFSYMLAGDTTIGAIDYSLMYARPRGETWYSGGESVNSVDTTTAYELVGAIREDDSQRVWYLNIYLGGDLYGTLDDGIYSDTESLLFDFSLTVGDTMVFNPNGIEPDTAQLLSLSVDQDTGWPLYEFDNGHTWVQGVGGLQGGPFCQFIYEPFNVSGLSTDLGCVIINDQYIFGNSSDPYTCDGFVNSLAENHIRSITIYPNPSTGQFSIRIPEDSRGTLEIIDMQGKTVWAETVEPSEVYTHDIGHTSGIYLVKLQTDRAIYLSKLIIP